MLKSVSPSTSDMILEEKFSVVNTLSYFNITLVNEIEAVVYSEFCGLVVVESPGFFGLTLVEPGVVESTGF